MTFPDLPLDDEQDLLIAYEAEGIEFSLENESLITDWILETTKSENKILSGVTFIFCNDEFLHTINLEHLQHDTLTDVITFPYSNIDVEGDIFISIERIRENAKKFGVTELHELHRVMIHGILHLCGYGDKKPKEKIVMTEKENYYLAVLANL
jgi:probable rRNA maturation factor